MQYQPQLSGIEACLGWIAGFKFQELRSVEHVRAGPIRFQTAWAPQVIRSVASFEFLTFRLQVTLKWPNRVRPFPLEQHPPGVLQILPALGLCLHK